MLYIKHVNLYWIHEFWLNSREIKERIKKTKDEKKAKKAEVLAKSQKAPGKGNVAKGPASKGPKLGGGGGKRWSILVFFVI